MISKSAFNINNCAIGLQFTKNARTAWGHIIATMSTNSKTTLLLPSYIGRNDKEGSGVYDPVLAHSTDVCFYTIGEELEVDLASFEKNIIENNVTVALVIHYFGFCRSDMNTIKTICTKHKVVLVEDCAHAFHLGVKDQIIGNYGDYSFYSVHKYLPTNSGGVLKTNIQALKLPSVLDEQKMTFSDLEIFSNSDFSLIASIRRNNYLEYVKRLSKNDNLDILYSLDINDIPQTFPVRIKRDLREKLYFYLLERDLPTVALYYRMIEEIDLTKFPLSGQISQEILNFPVHQDTSIEDIETLTTAIDDFFKLVNYES